MALQYYSTQLTKQLREATQQISLTPALSQGYCLALCDSSVSFPFQLTPELLHRATILARAPLSERPKLIFDYLHSSIKYGKATDEFNSDFDKKYAMSTEVWKYKRGVCGEMTYLYVSMARFAGLTSGYVSVQTDMNGRNVRHACASVQTNSQAPYILADIAYHKFGVAHKNFEIISDERAWELFRLWR